MHHCSIICPLLFAHTLSETGTPSLEDGDTCSGGLLQDIILSPSFLRLTFSFSMDLSIGDRVFCTQANGVRVPATVVTTVQEGLFHLEYYRHVVTTCSTCNRYLCANCLHECMCDIVIWMSLSSPLFNSICQMAVSCGKYITFCDQSGYPFGTTNSVWECAMRLFLRCSCALTQRWVDWSRES